MRRLFSTLVAAFVLILSVLTFSQTAQAATGTLTFTPSATTVSPGDTVTLTWESTGVIDLEIWGSSGTGVTNGPIDPTGSIDIQLNFPGTYWLEVSGYHEDEPDVEIWEEIEITVAGDIVSVTAQCGSFTITNLLDLPLEGGYGSFSEPDADEYFTLGPNASRTFTTSRSQVDIEVGNPEVSAWQDIEGFAVPQDCDDDSNTGNDDSDNDDTGSDNKSGHPTVAPKAGVADKASMGPVGAVSIALLIGAGIAARRLRSEG